MTDKEKKMLFHKFRFTTYLSKVHDGTYIFLDEEKGGTAHWREGLREKCREVDTGEKIEKQLYSFKVLKRQSIGTIVGFLDVPMREYLFCDWNDITQKYYIDKEIKSTIRCAKVYYAANKSRLVPLTGIKEEVR